MILFNYISGGFMFKRFLSIICNTTLVVAILLLFVSQFEARSQYCTPYGYYPYYGYITRVVFNGINNSSSYASSGYSNYSNISSNPCIVGQTYQLQIYGYSLWGSYYPGFLLYIDWNHDYRFDEQSELVAYSWSYRGTTNYNFTVNVTIPSNASPGPTRMRINYSGYYYYSYYVYYYYGGACGGYYYMEWEDYTINVMAKSNDAGISDIVSPTDKFDSYQNQSVQVRLKNFGKFYPLTSVTINWSVDGVTQTPYYWTGNLDTGQTTIVTLDPSFRFTPQAPWGPFTVRAWTTDPQGTDPQANTQPDGDASNDSYTKQITPILNDAGFLNADGMIPIEPGVNPVKLRIKNYAPKPLTSCQINWAINGVTQTPYYWTGNLEAKDSIDVIVGYYDFGTANLPFYIKGWTSNPNGYPDENTANDERTVEVFKALATGTYTIGGRNPDFTDIIDFVSYISYWGIAGPVTMLIRPGTYDAGVTLEPRGSRQFPLTFQSFTGRNDDVIIQNNPNSPCGDFVFQLNRYNGITFKNLTLKNNNGSSCPTSTIIKMIGGNRDITLDNCILIGPSNPAQSPDFALIVSDDNMLNNFRLLNCTLRNGSVGFWQVSPMGQFGNNFEIENNVFVNQNWQAVHIENVSGVSITDNSISGNGLLWGVFLSNYQNLILISYDKGAGDLPLQSGLNITGNRISGVGPAATLNLDDNSAGISITYDSLNYGPLVVSDNVIMPTNTNGIYIYGPSDLTLQGNQISISSTGSYDKAAIAIFNTNTSAQSLISGNSVNGSSSTGFYFSGVNGPKIYQNYIKLSGGNKYGFNFMNSSVTAANNIITTMNASSMYLSGVTNSMFFYNTFAGNTGLSNVMLNSLGEGNIFKRNMNYNRGTGYAIQYTGYVLTTIVSDENNIYTGGTVLANFMDDLPTLSDWRNATGLDLNSSSVMASFLSEDNPRINRINRDLYYTYRLPELMGSPLQGEIEDFDIDGTPRKKAFYVGANTLNPEIRITTQPNDIINCVGSLDNYFSIVAEIDFGGTLSYQWYKNGVPIDGATDAIYMLPPLTNEMAGVFSCQVMGNGEADPVFSKDVLLYAVEPTTITRQPDQVYADVGTTVAFQIDVHINTPDQPAFQPKIQWYRGTMPLDDNDRIAGSKSSLLSIRDIKPIDFGNDYYVVVEGICGSDTSSMITLSAKPKVIAQPLGDVEGCEGENITLQVDASSSVSGFNLMYQWKFNGAELQEGGKYNGVNTAMLTINNASKDDIGTYSVVVTIEGFDQIEVGPAQVMVYSKPAITNDIPASLNVESGKELKLEVQATGDDLSYQWYKDGAEIPYTGATLTIDPASASDAGTYKVKVYNQCGEVWSGECAVTVTFKIILGSEEEGYGTVQLFQNVPNPFDNRTKVEFYLPYASNIRFTISNMLGENLAVYSGNYQSGLNSIEINPKDINLVPGVYIYTLEANGVRLSRQMLFVK